MLSPPFLSSSGHVNKENIISPTLERIDPTPNIVDLFRQFNRKFFWSKLDMVEVSWSSARMTSCAGVCSFSPRAGHCHIRLSAPLLSLRPRKDLVETLLHEMIHAFLFMTKNYKDRSDHGPEFHKHMYRINQEAGTNISVFHTFNDEVRSLQGHVWRCNGPCRKMSPFFGFVRRANNRAPGPNDNWWNSHKMKCNGEFEKIQEPAGYKDKRKKGATKSATSISNFFTPTKPASNNYTGSPPIQPIGKSSNIHTFGSLSSGTSAHPTASSKTGNGSASSSYPNPRKGIFSRETSNKGTGTVTVSGTKPPSTTMSKTGTGQSTSSSSYPNSRVGIFSRETSNNGTGTVTTWGSSQPHTTMSKPGTGPSTSSISYPPSRVRIFSRETSDKGSGTAVMPANNQPSNTLSRTGTGSASYQSNKSASIFTTSGSIQHSSTSATASLKVPNAPSATATAGETSTSIRNHVRDIWASKYPAKKESETAKKEPETTKRKPEGEVSLVPNSPAVERYYKEKKLIVQCESCGDLFDENDLSGHEKDCEGAFKPCPVCTVPVASGCLEDHLSFCLSDSITEDIFPNEDRGGDGQNVACPICSKPVLESEINSHIDECLNVMNFPNEFCG